MIEAFEQWTKFSKNINPSFLGNWNKTANETFCHIMQRNVECINDCVSNACNNLSDQFQNLSEIKPENFLSFQKECLNTGISSSVTNVQKIFGTAMANMEELTKVFMRQEQPIVAKSEKLAK